MIKKIYFVGLLFLMQNSYTVENTLSLKNVAPKQQVKPNNDASASCEFVRPPAKTRRRLNSAPACLASLSIIESKKRPVLKRMNAEDPRLKPRKKAVLVAQDNSEIKPQKPKSPHLPLLMRRNALQSNQPNSSISTKTRLGYHIQVHQELKSDLLDS